VVARRPWWYLTKTARQSFLLGVFWCLLGSVMLLGGGGHAWSLVVGIAWLVCWWLPGIGGCAVLARAFACSLACLWPE
jgi:hypothetical protein